MQGNGYFEVMNAFFHFGGHVVNPHFVPCKKRAAENVLSLPGAISLA